MKELDSFTVERLEKISTSAFYYAGAEMEEIQALAIIALAAKRAEPVAWKWRGAVGDIWTEKKERADFVTKFCPELPVTELYTTPQLNSPEIPEGWKLTPLKPTVDMIAAAMECDDVVYDLDDDTIFCVQFDNIYAAMLAAAPEKENG